jgi:hypothetical protein
MCYSFAMERPKIDNCAVTMDWPEQFELDNFLHRRYLSPELISRVSPFKGNPTQEVDKFLDSLSRDRLRDWTHLIAPDQTLRVLVVEEMPAWKKPHQGHFRYGAHLGINHYIFNPDSRSWYLLAWHGRGRASARYKPYARAIQASQRMADIGEQIESGAYLSSRKLVNGPLDQKSRRLYQNQRHQWEAWDRYHDHLLRAQKKEQQRARRLEGLAERGSSSLLYGKR